jgi:hypothetical protein
MPFIGIVFVPANAGTLRSLMVNTQKKVVIANEVKQSNEIATPSGLAMTCKGNKCVYINSEF